MGKKTIGIIGGGIQGLAIGRLLAKKGYAVSIFEADKQLGGAVADFSIAGNRLDRLYHHLYLSDTRAIAWIKDLKLSRKFVWRRAKMGLLYQKKLYPFETTLDIIKFPPLTLWQRFLFGLGGLRILRIKDWRPLEKITADRWMPKMMGEQGYKVIFQPLLRSKFGSSYKQISAAWFWRKINDRNSTRAGSQKKEELGYLKGSFGQLIEAIAQDIKKNGGKIYKNKAVEKLIIKNGRAVGLGASGSNYYFDQIISTVHFDILRNIGKNNLPKKLISDLAKIAYQGAVVMVMQLKSSLSPYYWINICDADLPFVAVIEHTNYMPKSDYAGKNLVYLSNYVSSEDDWYRMPDADLLKKYIEGLRKIFPKFRRSWIEKYRVFRTPFGSPIFVKNYSKLILPYQSSVKDLFLVNLAQIYPTDRGTDKSILQAEEFVQKFF